MDKTTEPDILEQVKKVEKAVKAKLLIEKIAILKQHAREVNVLKEQSVATLEELNLSDKDIKRLIDYINELPEVKLTDKDKLAIREEAKEEVDEERSAIEEKLKDIDFDKLMISSGSLGTGGNGSFGMGCTNAIDTMQNCTTTESLNGATVLTSSMTNEPMLLNMKSEDGDTFSLKL